MKPWRFLPLYLMCAVWLSTTEAATQDNSLPSKNISIFNGTEFEEEGVTVTTSAEVTLVLSVTPEDVSMVVEAAAGAVTITVQGLNPSTTYHLYLDDLRNHELLSTDSSGTAVLEVDLSYPRSIFIQAQPSTVFVNAGGPSKPVGNWDPDSLTLTLTQDVFESIQIESSGITLEGSGHKITGTGGGNGIFITAAANVTVRNCEISNFNRGIFCLFTGGHLFELNTIHNNLDGVLLALNNSKSRLDSNIFRDNNRWGIFIVANSNGHEIINNQFLNNSSSAIFATGANNPAGTDANYISDIFISGNTFINNLNGVQMPRCKDFVVSNNNFLDHVEKGNFASAITMFQGSGHRFEGNYFSNNHFGIGIENISNTVWRSNTINDTVREAVSIFTDRPGFLNHDIDTSNTVDGKVIYYLKNQSGVVMNPDTFPNAATIYLINCDNMVVEDYTFDSRTENAVYLSGTTNSIVRRIQSFENNLGVMLNLGSSGNTVENCTIVERGRLENGIGLFDGGIRMIDGPNSPSLSTYNTIQNNVIVFLRDGFGGIRLLQGPSHNIIRGNILMGPTGTGIGVEGNYNLLECNVLSEGGGFHVLTAYGGGPLTLFRSDHNKVVNNVVRNGAGDFFSGAARGIRIEGADDLEVRGNIFINMPGDGIWITDQIFNFNTREFETFPVTNLKISGNDLIDNAQSGADPEGEAIFQVTSLAGSLELSVDGLGNFWNRPVAPYFVAGVDSNSTAVIDSYPSANPFVLVEIDIKPGEDPNSINLGAEGVVPVAILSSLHFDATTIDPDTVLLEGASVRLAGNGKNILAHEEDVNGDGLVDLVCKIEIKDTLLTEGQETAIVVGKTYDGQLKFGEDTVKIVP